MPDLGDAEDQIETPEGEDEEVEVEETDTADEPAKGESKRISDLQSEKDKETARANKLQKELDRLQGKAGSGEASDRGSDPEAEALRQELREASLDAVYGEFEPLKQFGISRDLIEGATRAEMRESASQLVSLVKSVETKTRNAVLKQHGLSAEPSGAARTPPKNYADMSAEDIEKEIARAKTGGTSLW